MEEKSEVKPEVKKTEEVKAKEDGEIEVKVDKKKLEEKVEIKKTEIKKTEVTKKDSSKTKTTETNKESKKAPSAADLARSDYEKAMQRYMGESSEAGGKGFGAAKIGGKGAGGGIVMPPEFFAYRQTVRSRVREGWNWFDTKSNLTTWVTFKVSPTGVITEVNLSESSGNREFDSSVLRAIAKASPLPPPPPKVLTYFAFVRMSFNPQD